MFQIFMWGRIFLIYRIFKKNLCFTYWLW